MFYFFQKELVQCDDSIDDVNNIILAPEPMEDIDSSFSESNVSVTATDNLNSEQIACIKQEPVMHQQLEQQNQTEDLLDHADPDMLIQLYVNNSENLVNGLQDQDAIVYDSENCIDVDSADLESSNNTGISQFQHFLDTTPITSTSTIHSRRNAAGSSTIQETVMAIQIPPKNSIGKSSRTLAMKRNFSLSKSAQLTSIATQAKKNIATQVQFMEYFE